jgi:5' nucleotidase family
VRERESISWRHKEDLRRHHEFFHPVWGQMLKAGYQNSMYASLLERFACLYTSHVSNLTLYSPYMKFRGRADVMAHEQLAAEDAGVDNSAWLEGQADRDILADVKPRNGH